MKVGVVGHGTVGKALTRWLRKFHDVYVYDKFIKDLQSPKHKNAINGCDVVFIAVPTPTNGDGMSCDISAVDEVVGWVQPPICIKSTIAPGTTDRLVAETRKEIAFSPEYIGESDGHVWRDVLDCGFSIVGGEHAIVDKIARLFEDSAGPESPCYKTTALTAEICKYMENCFLGTKVAFVNQFYDIARAFQIDFEELRLLWLADSRIGPSHTSVTEERGFGGRCLPKDFKAIVAAMAPLGGAPLLESIIAYNDRVRHDILAEKLLASDNSRHVPRL